ncbi:hypothetical protein [Mesorhizobium sp.]|uniref:hypothetical protein n=1 Tax=Mesorhizobium sp. TaxID=1871066 RepID=UPI000FE3D947|nr:hypothetical protein [Mesorhizobium sp.]RWB95515.1 MAG: hypothetical protein EOQ56_27575 [Mesorhizobium sp.]RWJ03381.1 MAG: hypothetical protein EOR24_31880 [Mesorhizobium sp.]
MQPQRTFEFKKPNRQKLGMPPKKPAAWSHQKDLDSLKGKKVKFGLLDSSPVTAVLIEADQYTVKIAGDEQSSKPVTIFKSALTYFAEV